MKSLWERIRHFDLSLEVDYKTLEMLRQYDKCIMENLVREGVRGKRVVGINRARKAQEALFWSDIATADGKKVDWSYRNDWKDSFEHTLGRHRSTFEYGLEWPSDQDWEDWNVALRKVTISRYLTFPRALGKWVANSPRIWRIFWNKEEVCL